MCNLKYKNFTEGKAITGAAVAADAAAPSTAAMLAKAVMELVD